MATTSYAAPSGAASAGATKRLLAELRDYARDPSGTPFLSRLAPVSDDSLFTWEAVMSGVPGSAYEDGRWLLRLLIPPNYPHHPPRVTFLTPLAHPNIDFRSGEICLDLLKPPSSSSPSSVAAAASSSSPGGAAGGGGAWTPAYTLATTLASVHNLLLAPEVDSPLNVDLAVLMRGGDGVGAEALVRYCCERWRYGGE